MYIDILTDINNFFDTHQQVSEYDFGNISNLSTQNRSFPLLFLQPESTNMIEFEINYNFSLYSLTLYEQDNENLKNGLNDTLEIIKDFIAYFTNNYNDDYWLENATVDVNPLTGEFDDYLVGWVLNFNFKSENEYDSCNIPID